MEKKFVTLMLDGCPLSVPVASLLSDAISADVPCGGRGRCGKCRVWASGALSPISDAERNHLTEEELRAGVRLACMTYIEGDCEVRRNETRAAKILAESDRTFSVKDPPNFKYGMAVDIGTTTLAAKLFDGNGQVLAVYTAKNPQAAWGADVVSRIEAALDGKGEELRLSILSALDEVTEELAKQAAISPLAISCAVLTGNTAMLHLLTGSDVTPLSRAPFEAKRLFGEYVSAKSLGLSALADGASIYLPPCISAFVGADTVCAILATKMVEAKSPMLLCDIGTNGEMALAQNGEITVCSTAAGPAFEGATISCGMRAEEGAIESVVPLNGKPFCHVIGNSSPVGICGSGLVDAIACLLDTEELDSGGYLEPSPYPLAGGVCITQEDIRAVQLAKSAICAGIVCLLAEKNLPTSALSRFYIAGGFGHYLNTKNAEKIGLIPQGLAEKAEAVGNAALAGAVMLLLDSQAHTSATEVARSAKLLPLANNPTFVQNYIDSMLF